MRNDRQVHFNPMIAPLHPQTVKLNKALLENKMIGSVSDNNTILDTISSYESRQYSYNSPQPGQQFNNKLKAINLLPNPVASRNAESTFKEGRMYANKFESPQNTAYFRDSSIGQNYDEEDYYAQMKRNQITPNSLDYSASTDFNAQSLNFNYFQKNFKAPQNFGNIESQHEQLLRANPLNYDRNNFATLGQSPGFYRKDPRTFKDEELESTVLGQSPINQRTYDEGNTGMSEDQVYLANMKINPHPIGGLSRANQFIMNQNLQSLSSSAESTPNKTFKAALLSRQNNKGTYLTSYPLQSDSSITRSYESDIRDSAFHNMNFDNQIKQNYEARINNEMDDDKGSFNPMSTVDPYDLKKYANKNDKDRDEIYIDQNVHPIMEQSDEDSRRPYTGNTTPISSEPRGAYPVSSSNTPQDNSSGNRNISPYATFKASIYDKSANNARFALPKFKDDDRTNDGSYTNFNASNEDNALDEKTTDLTGPKSYIDKQSSNFAQTMRNDSSQSYYKGEESLMGSHLFQKYQMNNLQFSQYSQGSIGPYDGATTSKILSSPAIYERGPESEDESHNDSQLKMSQLNNSLEREQTQAKLNYEDLEQQNSVS